MLKYWHLGLFAIPLYFGTLLSNIGRRLFIGNDLVDFELPALTQLLLPTFTNGIYYVLLVLPCAVGSVLHIILRIKDKSGSVAILSISWCFLASLIFTYAIGLLLPFMKPITYM